MKKLSAVKWLLVLALLLQMVCVPAFATEASDTAENTEETLATESVIYENNVTDGTSTVLNGCRTIEAQMPLGGSDRLVDTAVSAFIYERNTGTVIYAFNPDLNVQPGTFAKIVTAIVAIENGNLDDDVTISSANYRTLPAGASNAKLKEGEVMKLRDLLYCMIMEWANDAALTIAEHIAGSEAAFVELMNDWVQNQAGCLSTRFSNCHGLGSAEQATTARDMIRIVNEATKNTTFAEYFATTAYTVPETNKSDARDLKCLNYLMEQTIVPQYNFDGVTGGLAHYTATSGASLVCTAEKKNMSLVVAIMGCERTFASNGWTVTSYGNYEEVWNLLEYAFDNYKICRLLHDGQSLTQFPVTGGENDVVAQSHASVDAVLPINARLNNLILKYSVANGGLTAPIVSDQKVASMQIWYRNSCIAETNLYAMSSVRSTADSGIEIRGAARDDSNLSDILSFIGIVCLVILGALVLYLLVNHTRRIIARNRRRRRRKSRRRSR